MGTKYNIKSNLNIINKGFLLKKSNKPIDNIRNIDDTENLNKFC